MIHASYADLQQNLSRYLDEAIDTRVPIVVPCRGGKGNVVIVAEAEFDSWRETVHLLSNPKNAEALLRGLREAESGQLTAADLLPNSVPDIPV